MFIVNMKYEKGTSI